MALPFEVQIGRVSRFLTKWGSTKGSSPRVTLGSEVTPVLPFWSGVENRFLDSWNRFGAFTSVAASVGNNSGFRFRNPVASKLIAVLELCRVEVDTTLTQVLMESAASTTDLGSTITSRALDTRPGITSSALIVSAGNAVASLGAGTGVGFVAANIGLSVDFILTENQEIPVLPGNAVQIFTNASNVLMRCCVTWRERSLEESEQS